MRLPRSSLLSLRGRRLQAEAATATGRSRRRMSCARPCSGLATSHDLRTPLASRRASATSLLSEEIDWDRATTKELLQTITTMRSGWEGWSATFST